MGDVRRTWLERIAAAAGVQAEALRSGDAYYHQTLLEDLEDLRERVMRELSGSGADDVL